MYIRTILKISIPSKYLQSYYLTIELIFDGNKHILTDLIREQELHVYMNKAIQANTIIDLNKIVSKEELSQRREFTIDLDGMYVCMHVCYVFHCM